MVDVARVLDARSGAGGALVSDCEAAVLEGDFWVAVVWAAGE